MIILRALRRGGALIGVVACVELTVAVIIAHHLVGFLEALLRFQPDGVLALTAHGGRGAIDFLLRHGPEALEHAEWACAAIGLYAIVSLPLSAMLAFAAVAEQPLMGDAFRRSLRAFPALAALQSLSVLALAISAASAFLAARWTLLHFVHAGHARFGDLSAAVVCLPALFVALAASVWHDLAVIACVVRRAGILSAIRTSWLDVRRRPAGLVWSLTVALGASAALYAAGVAMTPRLETSTTLVAWIGFILQQSAAFARVVLRAGWLAFLACATDSTGRSGAIAAPERGA